MYEGIYKELESQGWPDARRIKPDQKNRITKATSFLDSELEVQKFSQRLFCIYQKLDSAPTCPVCGSVCKYSPKKKWEGVPYSGWTKYCSKECAYKSDDRMEKFKSTMVDRYGVEFSGQSKELHTKSQDTLEKRTGYRFALQSDEYQEKFKSTMNDRYGAEYTMSSEDLYSKTKQTMTLRYGTEYARQNDYLNTKAKATLKQRYGVEVPIHNQEIKDGIILEVISDEAYQTLSSKEKLIDLYVDQGVDTAQIAKDLDVCRTTVVKYLHRHNIPINYGRTESFGEREVREFIDSLGFSYEVNNKTLIDGNKHVDIYVRERRIAIEYNGLYYHSSKFKPKDYHQNKSLRCMENGVKLFHIWEDDWNDPVKRDIIKNKLRIELGEYNSSKLPARKTEVREVDYRAIHGLLSDNHIQGMVKGSFYNALFDGDDIVAAMIMQKNKDNSWELVRFCSDRIVQGGFSKLLKHFKNNNEWAEIYTFADLSISHGGLYERTGFTKSHITKPIMWYTKDGKKYRRERFMKHKLPKIFDDVDMSITEREIMADNGYNQIYDSGLIKYVMVK